MAWHIAPANLRNCSSQFFTLHPFFVHKVLGIPLGGTKIDLKSSEESSSLIKQVKHICSTPFGAIVSSSNYIAQSNADDSSNFPIELRESTRRKLSNITHKFHMSIFEAIKPAVANYASEYVRILVKDQFPSYEFNPSDHYQCDIDKIPFCIENPDPDDHEVESGNFSESDDEDSVSLKNASTVTLNADNNARRDRHVSFSQAPPTILHSAFQFSNSKSSVLLLDPPLELPEPSFQDDVVDPFIEMVEKMEMLSVDTSFNMELPYPYASLEDYYLTLFKPIDVPQTDTSMSDKEVLKFCFEDHISSIVAPIKEEKIFRCFVQESSAPHGNIANSSLSFSVDAERKSDLYSKKKPNTQGMSLNERFHALNSHIKCSNVPDGTHIHDPSASFDRITADFEPVQVPDSQPNTESGNIDPNLLESITTSIAKIYEDHATMAQYGYQERLLQDLTASFVKCSQMINEIVVTPKSSSSSCKKLDQNPVVFATESEKLFYDKFTGVIPNVSPSDRIFQVGKTWIDRRTLALSMRHGCWFHKIFFCKKIYFTKMSVYMPFSKDNQWVLVVANLASCTFDILNPDFYPNKLQKFIDNVIYNFKNFFLMAYHESATFNIRHFKPRYVKVPKQNFRYDSGIIILRFLQTYDGDDVQEFSNIDLLPLRQKLLFQLLAFNQNIFVESPHP
ncbi:hypothetical protein EJB05_43520, partial [Eragrostis curvula]